jgi:hypothetical protein
VVVRGDGLERAVRAVHAGCGLGQRPPVPVVPFSPRQCQKWGDPSSAQFFGKHIQTVDLDASVLAGPQFHSEPSRVQPRKVPDVHYASTVGVDKLGL